MKILQKFVTCALVLVYGAASAQVSALKFHVQDASGAVIPRAVVTLSRSGQRSVRGVTDFQGEVILQGADGTYDVLVEAQGFHTENKINLSISSAEGATITMGIVVIYGPVAEVTAPPMETESSPSSAFLSEAGTSVLPESSVAHFAKSTPWEYGAFFQGGPGLEDRTNFSFLLAGVQVGKVLTPELGHGLLKGNFEYAVQVIPYWESFTPKFQRISCTAFTPTTPTIVCTAPYTVGGTYHGVSITPIVLRWNLTHGKKLMPWVQAAGGVLYTTQKYPAVGDLVATDPTQTGPAADTSVWNFTPQGGVGAHYFIKDNRSVDFSANGVHISSASLGDKNPGVNVSLQMSVGYTWWKKQ